MLKLDLRIFSLLVIVLFDTSQAGETSFIIDNEIIGDPDVECMQDEIRIAVKTRKAFAGRMYAKGRANDPKCFFDEFDRDRTTKPHYTFRIGDCGMKSMRSLDPRGMYYSITLVVTFDKLLITKPDQAFHVKCFFEESSKGLTAELGVSSIPTTELDARHGIPGCSYSIHSSSIEEIDAGRPAGNPIQFARIGDKVLHQWHCNDNMYGILVRSCYVTDGFGNKVDVIDEKGCAKNPLAITAIRYSKDLQRAYAESRVFKFADKPGVWFFCQIDMCMKGMCEGHTPPPCASVADSDSPSFGISPSGNVPIGNSIDGDEDYAVTEQTPKPRPRKQKIRTTTPDYSEDYEQPNKEAKFHSPDSRSYFTSAATHDYEIVTEPTPVTPFAPPFSAATSSRPTTTFPSLKTSESVSQSFETEDDLNRSTPTPGKKKSNSNDYNEYDEVTIPPNLADLLASLPDDVSPEGLQKMFKDDVTNRQQLIDAMEYLKIHRKKNQFKKPSSRSMRQLEAGDLRSGDKIDQIEVDWSARLRDSLLIEDDYYYNGTAKEDVPGSNGTTSRNSTQKRAAKGPPMIAGQLLIYDLDEAPEPRNAEAQNAASVAQDCAISRVGLMAVAGGMGTICATLFFVALTFYIKLHKSQVADKLGHQPDLHDRFAGDNPQRSGSRSTYASYGSRGSSQYSNPYK